MYVYLWCLLKLNAMYFSLHTLNFFANFYDVETIQKYFLKTKYIFCNVQIGSIIYRIIWQWQLNNFWDLPVVCTITTTSHSWKTTQHNSSLSALGSFFPKAIHQISLKRGPRGSVLDDVLTIFTSLNLISRFGHQF